MDHMSYTLEDIMLTGVVTLAIFSFIIQVSYSNRDSDASMCGPIHRLVDIVEKVYSP